MYTHFFPGPAFAWLFYIILVSLTVMASYTDLRKMVVPKWITLPALGIGILFNVLRGGMLGGQGWDVWMLGAGGVGIGIVDGLLFALAGFLLGFAVFFGMWVMGICGGGDVKLFAAVGAWVGPYLAMWVLAGSMAVVIILMMVQLVRSILFDGYHTTVKSYSLKHGKKAEDSPMGKRARKRLMTYSFPLAVATAVLLLWAFRVDLGIAAEPQVADSAEVTYAK